MEYKETLMWQELNEAPAVLETLQEKNAAVLGQIVKAVRDAQITNVYTAARGTSDHAMIYFKYLAESLLGLPVASGAPAVATMYGAKLALGHSLVIGCSQSGKAADVMEVVREANESGAVTVAITNGRKEPARRTCKVSSVLFCGRRKERGGDEDVQCAVVFVLVAYLCA